MILALQKYILQCPGVVSFISVRHRYACLPLQKSKYTRYPSQHHFFRTARTRRIDYSGAVPPYLRTRQPNQSARPL
jgi:hypothetical protein